MESVKKCLTAGLVGGLLGVLGQLFYTLLGLIPGLEPKYVVYGTLILMGIGTLVTYPLGLYQKVMEVGGFGALLPFSGFAAAIADAFTETKRKTQSAGRALWAGVAVLLTVIGIGTILVAAVAAMVYYVLWGGQSVEATSVSPVTNVLLCFVFAFLVCGILSMVFQAFMMVSKLSPPVILIIGFTVGMVLVPLGALDWLQATGGAGAFITVMAAGGAMGSAFLALFAGDALSLIEIVTIFVTLTIIGVLAGLMYSLRTPGEKEA